MPAGRKMYATRCGWYEPCEQNADNVPRIAAPAQRNYPLAPNWCANALFWGCQQDTDRRPLESPL